VGSSQCGQGREMELLKAGRLAAVVLLPAGFGRDLEAGQTTAQVFYDATDPARGAQARSAVAAVIGAVNRSVTDAAEPIRLLDSGVDHRPMRQIDWLTPGMVGLLVMLINLVVGATIILWRDRGVLKRLAATPLRPLTLILSQIAARL